MKVSLAVFLVFVPAAFAQATLGLPDLNASPGTQLIIPVQISEGTNISGVQFTLEFGAALLEMSDESTVFRGSSLRDHTVGLNFETVRIRILIFSVSLRNLTAGCSGSSAAKPRPRTAQPLSI